MSQSHTVEMNRRKIVLSKETEANKRKKERGTNAEVGHIRRGVLRYGRGGAGGIQTLRMFEKPQRKQVL